MHILTLILMLVIGSIAAACKGDFSGLEAIGKFVGVVAIIIAVMWLFTQPILLILVIAVLIIVVIAGSHSSK